MTATNIATRRGFEPFMVRALQKVYDVVFATTLDDKFSMLILLFCMAAACIMPTVAILAILAAGGCLV